jgi:hypothetical protein
MPSIHSYTLNSAATLSVYLDKISERNAFHLKFIKTHIDSDQWLKADEILRQCRKEFNNLALEIKTRPLTSKHKKMVMDLLAHHNKKLDEIDALIKDKIQKIAAIQITEKVTEEHPSRKNMSQNFLMQALAHPATSAVSALLFIASIVLLTTTSSGIALGLASLVVSVGFFVGHMTTRHNKNETQHNTMHFA